MLGLELCYLPTAHCPPYVSTRAPLPVLTDSEGIHVEYRDTGSFAVICPEAVPCSPSLLNGLAPPNPRPVSYHQSA